MLGAVTKVGGNAVGDSVVWSEAGQELVLSKWQKGSFRCGVWTRAGSANASMATTGRMVPKNRSCVNAAELADHLTRGVADNTGAPDDRAERGRWGS
jgi:hypothetical protein